MPGHSDLTAAKGTASTKNAAKTTGEPAKNINAAAAPPMTATPTRGARACSAMAQNSNGAHASVAAISGCDMAEEDAPQNA